MIQQRLVSRTMVTSLCAGAMVLGTVRASAKDTVRICTPAFAAYKEAALQWKAGHLHEAREQLQICLESECAGLKPKCAALNDKVIAQLPSVVLVVNDEAGNPQTDVQVSIDGEVVASKLDGMAVPLEPGVHEFAFSSNEGVFATQKLMIREGERDWPIEITMHGPAAAGPSARPAKAMAVAATKAAGEAPAVEKRAPDEESNDEKPAETRRIAPLPRASEGGGGWALPASPLPYVIGGAGLAAVAAGGLLTYWGNKDNTELQNQCAPNCSPSDADHIKKMYVASDIAFGAGLAALGITTWLFASSRSSERAPRSSAAALSIVPTASGAFASVSKAF